VFTVFALNGLFFATWASRLPAVRDALDRSPGALGLLLLVGSAGSLVALPLTGMVVHRIGTARTTRMATLLAAAGLGAAALWIAAGSAPGVAITLFLGVMGIAAWDVSMNLQGTVVEQARGRAIMPRFHAGFSLGAVAGAALGALAAGLGVSVTWHLITVVALGTVAAWRLTRAYLPDGAMVEPAGDGVPTGSARRALRAWAEPRTVLIGLMVLAAALTEGSANDWLALAVVDGFDASDAIGAAAFGLFVASMTVMRFAGTRLLDRHGRVPILRLSAGLALLGLLGFALLPSLPMAAVAIVLWGMGAALGFPVGMSAAADDPRQAAARVSVVSSIGYVAFLAGPPLLGALADHIGYRHALLTIAVPLVLSLLLARVAAPLPADTDEDVTADSPMHAG
jgi:MFS family permease